MDALPVPVPPVDLARFDEALGSARGYAASSKANRTRTAYGSALRAFAAWCEGMDASPLPASAETAAAYFAHLADTGRKVATIDLHAAAIAFAHRAKGHEPPTQHRSREGRDPRHPAPDRREGHAQGAGDRRGAQEDAASDTRHSRGQA